MRDRLFRPIIKQQREMLTDDDRKALEVGRAVLLLKGLGMMVDKQPVIHVHQGDQTVSEGAVQVEHHSHIDEGAIHAPISVPVTIEKGAVQNTHTLPPTNVQVHQHEAPIEGDATIVYDPMGRPKGIRRG